MRNGIVGQSLKLTFDFFNYFRRRHCGDLSRAAMGTPIERLRFAKILRDIAPEPELSS